VGRKAYERWFEMPNAIDRGSGCEVWGILNVTPDSFSDGGRYADTDAAVHRALQMAMQGAAVIDVGGASSRPRGATYGVGAPRVSADEECARVLPVIERLCGGHGLRVSIDTTQAQVADAALKAGATVINDVSGGQVADLLDVAARSGATLVLMHTRGDGAVSAANATYHDVAQQVRDELLCAAERAIKRGVDRSRIWLDPGIGFAKTPDQSLRALAGISLLVGTDYPVLLGASRKSFIAELCHRTNGTKASPQERLGGSIAAVTLGVVGGVRAVRVHDVAESYQAVCLAAAVRTGARTPEPRAAC
jgi:dihydropteroate synthase